MRFSVTFLAVPCLILSISNAMAQELNIFDRLQFGFDSTAQFISWKTKRSDQRGYQFYTSTQGTVKALRGEVLELDFGIKTGYIQSRSTVAGFGGGVSTLTDTVIQLQSSYKGFGAFQPFATLAINLPTGAATLKGNERRGVMDKDLVFQTRFGEGWNFNPGIGFVYVISPEFTTNFGIGYNARSAYIPNGDTGASLKPGDQIIATSGLNYKYQALSIGVTGTATYERDSFNDGEKSFKPGNSYTLGLNSSYAWNEQHSTNLSGSYTYTGKNMSFDFFTGVYGKEAKNSNSSVISATLQQNYQISSAWNIFARATYLSRDKNLYDPVADQFASAKTKLSGDIGGSMSLTESTSLNASFGLFRLRQNPTPYSEAQLSRGVQGSLGVRVGF